MLFLYSAQSHSESPFQVFAEDFIKLDRRDRMLASAQNFALGFFGYPYEGKYQESITIEAHGVGMITSPIFSLSQLWLTL